VKSRILVVTVEKDSHSLVDWHLIDDDVIVPRLRSSDISVYWNWNTEMWPAQNYCTEN